MNKLYGTTNLDFYLKVSAYCKLKVSDMNEKNILCIGFSQQSGLASKIIDVRNFFSFFICLSGVIFEYVCVLFRCNQGKVMNPVLHCTYFFSYSKYFPMHRKSQITMLLRSMMHLEAFDYVILSYM